MIHFIDKLTPNQERAIDKATEILINSEPYPVDPADILLPWECTRNLVKGDGVINETIANLSRHLAIVHPVLMRAQYDPAQVAYLSQQYLNRKLESQTFSFLAYAFLSVQLKIMRVSNPGEDLRRKRLVNEIDDAWQEAYDEAFAEDTLFDRFEGANPEEAKECLALLRKFFELSRCTKNDAYRLAILGHEIASTSMLEKFARGERLLESILMIIGMPNCTTFTLGEICNALSKRSPHF